MATIKPTIEQFVDGDTGTIRVTWANMANGDVGQPVKYTMCPDRSVQLAGTLGAGGSARWEGSNDEINYVVLTDPQANALDFTSLKIETVMEVPLSSRPRITAGDGTTSLTVTAIMRRSWAQNP
jgi:hypothetical protein